VLIATGLLVRFRLRESPVFEDLKDNRREVSLPLTEAVRRYPKEIVLTLGLRMAENSGFYIFTVFVLVYATEVAGISRQDALNGVLIASAGALVSLPVCGAIFDRIGRRPVYLFGAVAMAVLAFPFFLLMETHSVSLLWLGLSRSPHPTSDDTDYGPWSRSRALSIGPDLSADGRSRASHGGIRTAPGDDDWQLGRCAGCPRPGRPS